MPQSRIWLSNADRTCINSTGARARRWRRKDMKRELWMQTRCLKNSMHFKTQPPPTLATNTHTHTHSAETNIFVSKTFPGDATRKFSLLKMRTSDTWKLRQRATPSGAKTSPGLWEWIINNSQVIPKRIYYELIGGKLARETLRHFHPLFLWGWVFEEWYCRSDAQSLNMRKCVERG